MVLENNNECIFYAWHSLIEKLLKMIMHRKLSLCHLKSTMKYEYPIIVIIIIIIIVIKLKAEREREKESNKNKNG